ncbi:hypothetical protein [Photobacterium nomapromontoriensis]|uniref:hypothetical protein n=1 Tax=Photobacterium nomapromontoriensis TaxID=2910237 RepID=UPI003D0DFE49
MWSLYFTAGLIISLFSCSVLAEIHPTSSTLLTEEKCRLDIYHLVKNNQNQYEPNLQLAVITDNTLRHRFVALKTDISHPTGFENISYNRSGRPHKIFTVNWRNNGTAHTVSRLVMLGGTSDKQAFDIFTRSISNDNGHFELVGNAGKYRFNVKNKDIDDFFQCMNTFYQY